MNESFSKKFSKKSLVFFNIYKKTQYIVYFFIDNHNHLCNIAALFVFYNF